ncbi:MAG: hypothetical protein KAJ05_02295 [Candidatus Latescibacteria bacterium]|nr:hypothetical protein [Candidatus Latescibacterota bacterium]
MEKVRLGFIPAHRVPFNEDWAVEMRKRTLEALAGIEEIEVVVPGPELTQNGLVRDDAEAEKVIGLFEEQGVEGLLLGAMTFGDEISAVSIVENMDVPALLSARRKGRSPRTADGARMRSAGRCPSHPGCTAGRFPLYFRASGFRRRRNSLGMCGASPGPYPPFRLSWAQRSDWWGRVRSGSRRAASTNIP